MRKIWFGALSLAILGGCSAYIDYDVPFFSSLPQGVTLVEEVEAQPGKATIPYSKYQLENGLTVILSPDHSDPLVHVDVTYHVGSAREEIGKSGFAHFFEHMMFQGSEHVGDQEHFRIITEAGGRLNGTTNRDRTNYFETVPANQLEKMLWLESDRMGYLLDAVSQRKFEVQRDTVKNERAQNYDNRPYGLIWEKMGEAMFPEGHPYSWQTIGYVEDLDRVDVNDLKAFFLRWYGPNNAVLTIGGDIDVEQTLEWINKYFAPIPRGPEVERAPKQPVTLERDKFVTLEDRIRQPMVVLGWPTEYRGHESQLALNALATQLGDGANSMLYQNLVKTEKALDVGAFQDCSELSCAFYVYAMAPSGDSAGLKSLYDDIMTTLAEFEQHGISQQRLDQIIGVAEADSVFALQSVEGKVTQLASNETFFAQPDRLQSQLDRLKAVTPQSVMQVYKQYVNGHHKVTLSVVPVGKTQLAAATADFVTPARRLPVYSKVSEQDLEYRRPVDNFDRSVMPEIAQGVQAHMPELYRMFFDNGVEVLGTVSSETPTVQLDIRFPAGERYVRAGKEGLANLTAALLQEGSQHSSLEELHARMDKLGSKVSVNAGNYTTSVMVSSLEKNLPQTLSIVEEVLFAPAFKQEDFDRLKKQMLEGMMYQHQKPSWLASQATRQVLFGNTIYQRSGEGSLASLESLTLDDVKQFYRQHYTPQGAQVVVVGDISKKEVTQQLAFIQQWQGETAPLLRAEKLPELGKQKIYLVNKPHSPQSIVRFVRQGLPFDATGEAYLTQLANFNLAGNFNSRLNQNLREDKGYTYGAGGYLAANREIGALVFSAQVRANATLPSIIEMQKELTEYSASGMTTKELDFLKLAVGQQDALKYETPGQKTNLLGSILSYSLDEDYLQQRNEIVDTVDRNVLNGLSKKWFDPSQYQIIVVGDAQSLKPQLETLNIPVEELEIVH
ncbi:M16 family metallopeptidase [Vibrio intestinalis]|uniref:M16 family metallopeptidase n=1 Tax=Vibrio intestinalis TaxID=2933291 RepID=UPI0021A48D91|nr:pitrilysin family protein [Vibrio intestinalis]